MWFVNSKKERREYNMSTFLDTEEDVELDSEAIQAVNAGMSADMMSAVSAMLKSGAVTVHMEDEDEDVEEYYNDTSDVEEDDEYYEYEEEQPTAPAVPSATSILTQGVVRQGIPPVTPVTPAVQTEAKTAPPQVSITTGMADTGKPAPPVINLPDTKPQVKTTSDVGMQVLTSDERLRKYAEEILASVLKDDEASMERRTYLFGQFMPDIFRDENYIIYKILYKFKEQRITPDLEFMQMYLMRNEGLIRNSREFIKLDTYADLDENTATGYTIGVLKYFTRLVGMKPLEGNAFRLAIEKYKIEFENKVMNEAYAEAKIILNDGMEKRGYMKQGFEDSVAHVKDRVAYVESMIDRTAGEGFLSMQEVLDKESETQSFTKIGEFGQLKKLNKYMGGGIYKPYFYSVVAPTKGGKSKFCTNLIHNIVVENGNNAVVWAHEGGSDAWMAQFRAVHFNYYYNRDKVDESQMLRGITQDVIEKRNYPTKELESLENVSMLDLKTNPNYGNIEFISRPMNVETFIDEIETAVQKCNADIVLIDYLQMMDTVGHGKNKPEYIGRAYQKLLAYANHRNVAILSPAQYTQEFMKEVLNAKEGQQIDARTAGGESSEVIRTPDYNIALYASTEDLTKHRMKILSIPSRKCQAFPAIDIYHDLGICGFYDID